MSGVNSAIELNRTGIADGAEVDVGALKRAREARRGSEMVARLHHHAVRTDDMEKTRIFYEDILEMPMVSAQKEMVDPTTGARDPFLHCFFEMKDGSCIAFFQFLGREQAPLMPQDVFDHHLAVSVPNFEDLRKIKDRLEANGYNTAGIDHGYCYSLYVRDPNGMALELVGDPDNELAINEAFAQTAKADYQAWMNKEYDAKNEGGDKGVYPMQPSSFEDILKVLPANRDA
ncbi:MAG: bleomycin resistance protein [Bradyrhizobium sp.]|nr:bleomycin resistance protein [Bradyrhizobium sp.]